MITAGLDISHAKGIAYAVFDGERVVDTGTWLIERSAFPAFLGYHEVSHVSWEMVYTGKNKQAALKLAKVSGALEALISGGGISCLQIPAIEWQRPILVNFRSRNPGESDYQWKKSKYVYFRKYAAAIYRHADTLTDDEVAAILIGWHQARKLKQKAILHGLEGC